MTNANPYDLPDPSAGQTPGTGTTTPAASSGAGAMINGTPSDAFINALYPGYGVRNGQLTQIGDTGGHGFTDASQASAYVNSLWNPLSHQDYQGFFNQLMQGTPASPAMLKQFAPALQAAGFKLNANASGQYTDFTLPNGQVVDPIRAAGTGDPSQMQWQWLTGGGGGGNLGSLTAPFTEPFTPPQGPNLGGPKGLEYLPPLPQFKQPTLEDMNIDPGYQFRTQQGEQALEQSAAGRGVLNTGGTLKDILNYGQSAASQEFGNIWNRNLQAYQAGLQGWNAIAPVAQRENELDYSRAYDKWLQDYTIDRNQKNDTFTKQFQTTTA